MIDLKDLARPPVLLALAGSAAIGFAAGYLLGRDPQMLRRALVAAVKGWEQTRVAVAEAREDLADQWAEATESARQDIEEAAFGAEPVVAASVVPAPARAAAAAAPERGEPAPRAKRSRAARSRRAATRTTH